MNAVCIGWLQEGSVANIALVEKIAGEIHQVIRQHGVAIAGVAEVAKIARGRRGAGAGFCTRRNGKGRPGQAAQAQP
ncbi:hypothetical protein F506_08335 [Herbaspirillum hiltneri N3]|uniref:Uncharacterized protein n=1 Tax=Herbaspirillum hiltneri N3 TaxID=1262470 RepID=A0ABN4HV14_9BURK|nr:hypothetical protein F506_08335 [Herbaspirillum hiltneri N3]